MAELTPSQLEAARRALSPPPLWSLYDPGLGLSWLRLDAPVTPPGSRPTPPARVMVGSGAEPSALPDRGFEVVEPPKSLRGRSIGLRGELVVPPFVVGTAGEGVTRLRFDPNRPVTSDLTAVTDRPRTPLVCEGQGGLTGFCDLVLEVEAGAAYSMSAVPTDDGFSITFWEAATYRRLPFVVTPSLQGWFPELPSPPSLPWSEVAPVFDSLVAGGSFVDAARLIFGYLWWNPTTEVWAADSKLLEAWGCPEAAEAARHFASEGIGPLDFDLGYFDLPAAGTAAEISVSFGGHRPVVAVQGSTPGMWGTVVASVPSTSTSVEGRVFIDGLPVAIIRCPTRGGGVMCSLRLLPDGNLAAFSPDGQVEMWVPARDLSLPPSALRYMSETLERGVDAFDAARSVRADLFSSPTTLAAAVAQAVAVADEFPAAAVAALCALLPNLPLSHRLAASAPGAAKAQCLYRSWLLDRSDPHVVAEIAELTDPSYAAQLTAAVLEVTRDPLWVGTVRAEALLRLGDTDASLAAVKEAYRHAPHPRAPELRAVAEELRTKLADSWRSELDQLLETLPS